MLVRDEKHIVLLFTCGTVSIYIDIGCIWLGNPDLDFENLNPDFPIERTHILKKQKTVNKSWLEWELITECVFKIK